MRLVLPAQDPGFAQDHPPPDLSIQASYRMTIRDQTRPWAFVYCGEWVAECPVDGCANVEFLTVKHPKVRGRRDLPEGERKPAFACRNCLTASPNVEWPDEADAIMATLNRRPVPQTRNWYPEGHPHALLGRVEHGQSVADLEREGREHGIGVG